MNKILLLIFVVGCGQASRNIETIQEPSDGIDKYHKFGLKKMDSIIIPVNNLTSNVSYVQVVEDRGKEYLVNSQADQFYNYFNVYDLNEKSFHKTITIEKEGSNGVGMISVAVTFLNGLSKMLLTGMNTNRFYLADSSGSVHQRIDINEKINGVAYAQPAYPTILKNDTLHFFLTNASIDLNHREYTKKSIPEALYDLTTKELSNDFPKYPNYPNGIEKTFHNWKVSRCFGANNEFVYSFPFDNRLFVYKNGEMKSYNIPNQEFSSQAVAISEIGNIEEQMKVLSELGVYTYLFFDQYRNLYYRIFLKPGDFKDLDGNLIMVAERPFSIQVINSKFELVGKVDFPSKEYNPYCLLITKNGLLLSRINPHSPNFEDKYYFDRYEVVEL